MSYSAFSLLRDHPVLLFLFVASVVGLTAFTRQPSIRKPARKIRTRENPPIPQEAPVGAQSGARDFNGAPWVSDLFLFEEILGSYHPVYPDTDRKRVAASSTRNQRGLVLSKDWFFEKTQLNEYLGDEFSDIELDPPVNDQLKDIAVISEQFTLVSPALQSVLEAVNFGQGNFYKTQFVASDGVTQLRHRHKYWNIGNQKDTLIAEETPELKPIKFGAKPSAAVEFVKPKLLRDDMLCLSRDSLEGPDIWVETRLHRVVFFSDRLVRKLEEHGFASLFDFYRCRLPDEM